MPCNSVLGPLRAPIPLSLLPPSPVLPVCPVLLSPVPPDSPIPPFQTPSPSITGPPCPHTSVPSSLVPPYLHPSCPSPSTPGPACPRTSVPVVPVPSYLCPRCHLPCCCYRERCRQVPQKPPPKATSCQGDVAELPGSEDLWGQAGWSNTGEGTAGTPWPQVPRWSKDIALKPRVQTHLWAAPQCPASVSPPALLHALGKGWFLAAAARSCCQEGRGGGGRSESTLWGPGIPTGTCSCPCSPAPGIGVFRSLWASSRERPSALRWPPPPGAQRAPRNPAWGLSVPCCDQAQHRRDGSCPCHLPPWLRAGSAPGGPCLAFPISWTRGSPRCPPARHCRATPSPPTPRYAPSPLGSPVPHHAHRSRARHLGPEAPSQPTWEAAAPAGLSPFPRTGNAVPRGDPPPSVAPQGSTGPRPAPDPHKSGFSSGQPFPRHHHPSFTVTRSHLGTLGLEKMMAPIPYQPQLYRPPLEPPPPCAHPRPPPEMSGAAGRSINILLLLCWGAWGTGGLAQAPRAGWVCGCVCQ